VPPIAYPPGKDLSPYPNELRKAAAKPYFNTAIIMRRNPLDLSELIFKSEK
jgi:hypothetical protein